MMKKNVLLLLLSYFTASTTVQAQMVFFPYDLSYYQVLDTARYELTYAMRFKYDAKAKETYEDIRKVQVGSRIVKDYSHLMFHYDSLRTANEKKGLNSSIFQKPVFAYEIFNHYSDKTTLFVHRLFLASGCIGWQDAESTLDWKLEESDTVHILGYNCNKASVDFKGRHYTAWYSTAIPIAVGPYRFGGLPGLIMKIEESNGVFVWELKGMENVKKPICEYKYDKYTKCTAKDASKTIRRMFESPLSFLQSSGSNIQVKRPNGSFSTATTDDEKKMEYEEIELQIEKN
ncbi:MAG: GLPGLI family protein [Prevotella sp.]|nr:GLPGLI family protein [Prevotella sp.]